MRRARTLLALLLVLGFASPSFALAQQAEDPLLRAIASYRGLDYDDAATRFRAALAATGSASLTAADRTRALMHLAAIDIFRNRRE